jgi:hypothetical protein
VGRLNHRRVERSTRSLVVVGAFLAASFVLRSASAQSWRPEPEKNPSPSPAQIAEAKQRYEKGVKLYEEEGSVQAALVEFERAYELAPNYKVLYNIGQGARTLRDYASALQAFEGYLAGSDNGAKLTKARVAEVEREIAQLRTYVATLTVVVEPAGATVMLDGVILGLSPLPRPLLLNPGRVKISATKEGRTGATVVTLAGGEAPQVRVEIPPPAPEVTVSPTGPATAPATAPSEAPSTPLAPPSPDRTVTYLSFGVASALAVGAGLSGFAALRASNDLADTRFAGPRTPANATSLRNQTRTLSRTSDVLAGGALVAAAVGVVSLLLPASSRASASQTSSRPIGVQPYLAPTGAGLVGRF